MHISEGIEKGRNIVDAVAKEVHGLDEVGFIAGTLLSARNTSGGKYKELWYFDTTGDVFPEYVDGKLPDLAKKTSYLHTGYFFSQLEVSANPLVRKSKSKLIKW